VLLAVDLALATTRPHEVGFRRGDVLLIGSRHHPRRGKVDS